MTVVHWYPARVDAFMRNPAGPVARHMLQRADRVRESATLRVGKSTGLLASTIRVQQRTPPDAYVVAGDGTVRTAHLWPHLRGSAPHVIRVRHRKSLRFMHHGRVRFAVSVRHPGTRPNPFLTDALDAAR